MSGSLLKFEKKNLVTEEPIFNVGFGPGNIARGNFPKLPSGYTQVDGVRISTLQDSIPLGVIPKYTDTDIYIYIGFKVISVTDNYSCIIGTDYINEQRSVVRIITNNKNTTSFYTNMFTAAGNSSAFYSVSDINQVLMRKDETGRYYYNGINSSATGYSTLLTEELSELKLMMSYNALTLDLYGLFIRQNGTVYHNWIPCIRNSDSKYGFYNAVTREFITRDGMSTIS